jgi:hypothetical protein
MCLFAKLWEILTNNVSAEQYIIMSIVPRTILVNY